MRQHGFLTQWDDAKGYGFITPNHGEAKLFVHIKAFGLRAERPQLGELLSFELEHDAQGKRRAVKVRADKARLASSSSSPGIASSSSLSSLYLIPAFAAFYLLCHLLWSLPAGLWGAYMAMSLATFIVYAGDKRAASKGQPRVPERTLHGLAFACGWPGALLAQQLLRHKSSKPAFLRRFWGTVSGNVLLFTLAATPMLKMLWSWLAGR
ncbi:cold shock and DUF1294 domain-containing protein [Paucibacter sp. B2R-40]|uniref:cold shock and DUF1294 domain-containing protein n=1 Tax=Paucibacter sp. B2R-40 TaxID=2893554 RepID=UPI0021E3815D|nr:cold shock and DUF1294 domain-containing protein [Paucibacter sp. B2R-40]MCV2354086.1 cold shock and DUF1294 domain-containing protein [Paucibacter sp. B2R-40]